MNTRKVWNITGASQGLGLSFSILWASAPTATKIGLKAIQPFTMCIVRFFLAGLVMILISHILLRHRLPKGKEWARIAVYGLLSNTIYLGLFVLAMQHVSGGLGALAVATNPVFINLLTTVFLRERLKISTLLSLLLCMTGVTVAAWPLLQNSSSTPAGLLILLAGMLAYSISAFYFSRVPWNGLPLLVINGWQVLTGGIFLLPLVALTWHPALNIWNAASVGSVLWLAIPVSIGAVQLWLYLLKEDAAKASFWLFLCPVFGFLISYIFTGEPITGYTLIGMSLVIAGIYWQQTKKSPQVR
ncbi:MAG TPA: EamA family transporter [Puia sp.]|nr:EamA family transporter [Puia sp.]